MFLLSSRCKHRYLRGGGNSSPKNWRVNYRGHGYVEIPAWSNGEVEFEFTLSGRGGKGWNVLLDDEGGGGNYLAFSSSNTLASNGVSNIEINGVPVTSFSAEFGAVYKLKCMLTDLKLIHIGGNISGEATKGSITNIRLTKADGSDNRFYESIIKSDTQPDTLELVDSISGKNGTLINFPTGQEWTDTYNLANGLWDMSQRDLVSFTRSTKAWLDGKEYGVDEPRYKNGGLLVEPQRTNIITSANAINGWASEGGWIGDAKTVVVGGVEVITRTSTGYCAAWSSVHIVSDPSKTYSARLITKIHPSFTDIKNDGRGFTPSMTFTDELPNLGVVGNCEVTGYKLLDGGYIMIDCKFKNVSTGPYTVYFEGEKSKREFAFGWVGIEEGETLTSPIPVEDYQTTRAADIATVRDKS